MRDFTLESYDRYLQAIISSYDKIITFQDYLTLHPKPSSFCIIRHDVDRKPRSALKMAEFEKTINVRSTYFFRTKSISFKPAIIKSINTLGHEIGYHYECLSDTNGNEKLALLDFEKNLTKLRNLCSVKTIAMHGSPLKPYNNSDMWRSPQNRTILKKKYNILGEAYLDIDYSDIVYINDTGRNWLTSKHNVRDKVNSTIRKEFSNGDELHGYLSSAPHPKIVFQVHPERWTDNTFSWLFQFVKDTIANIIKLLVK